MFAAGRRRLCAPPRRFNIILQKKRLYRAIIIKAFLNYVHYNAGGGRNRMITVNAASSLFKILLPRSFDKSVRKL